MNVLVWGTAEQGPCAYFRGHMFDEEWKKMGISVRHIDKVNFIAKDGAQGLSQEKMLKAVQDELKITYANTYYYYSRVFKKA